jgi:hypothetical protein
MSGLKVEIRVAYSYGIECAGNTKRRAIRYTRRILVSSVASRLFMQFN